MEYRVAVLLSGQSRTYKIALDSIKYFFETQKIHRDGGTVKVDYYFHTWDTNQYTSKGSDKALLHTIPYEPADIDMELIRSKLHLIDYEIETLDNKKIHNAWGSLLYSFYRSNYLKRKYELENNFKYDMVVKTRFDIAYYVTTTFFYVENLERQCIYTTTPLSRMPREFNSLNFDDVWFYSDSHTMDLLSYTYNYVGEQIGNTPIRKSVGSTLHKTESMLGPGCLLNRFANIINIQGVQTGNQHGSYVVIRKNALEANLHSIQNYAELEKLNQEYYRN